MKNVYDILVNFKTVAFEFYEWDKEDEIRHVKVTTAYKVSDSCIFDFLNNSIKVRQEFLDKIKDKTQVFCGRGLKILRHTCIIYNNDLALALLFDDKGCVVGKSKLLFDEADEIVKDGQDEKETYIEYEILKKENINGNLTRRENKLIYILSKYLNRVYEKKEAEEIKYFYFECFNAHEENLKKAYQRLIININNADYEVINKLKNLIKVLKK